MPKVPNTILEGVCSSRFEIIREEQCSCILEQNSVASRHTISGFWLVIEPTQQHVTRSLLWQDGISHKTSPAYVWNTHLLILLERCTNRHNTQPHLIFKEWFQIYGSKQLIIVSFGGINYCQIYLPKFQLKVIKVRLIKLDLM